MNTPSLTQDVRGKNLSIIFAVNCLKKRIQNEKYWSIQKVCLLGYSNQLFHFKVHGKPFLPFVERNFKNAKIFHAHFTWFGGILHNQKMQVFLQVEGRSTMNTVPRD